MPRYEARYISMCVCVTTQLKPLVAKKEAGKIFSDYIFS